ncbi:MAG: pilus assembly protein TadB, partial [Pseudonocardiales bacterium]
MAVLNHGFVEVYDSAFGQVVLAGVIGVDAAGFLWLRRLARFSATGRFLVSAGEADHASAA